MYLGAHLLRTCRYAWSQNLKLEYSAEEQVTTRENGGVVPACSELCIQNQN